MNLCGVQVQHVPYVEPDYAEFIDATPMYELLGAPIGNDSGIVPGCYWMPIHRAQD